MLPKPYREPNPSVIQTRTLRDFNVASVCAARGAVLPFLAQNPGAPVIANRIVEKAHAIVQDVATQGSREEKRVRHWRRA